MAELLSEPAVRLVAWTHLNLLRTSGVLSPDFEGLKLAERGDEVHDVNGDRLFVRVPLQREGATVAFADIAVNPVLGDPFLAVSIGSWSSQDALKAAAEEASNQGLEFDQVRLVAYSYPKLAAQFLQHGDEVAMLELYSQAPVPKDGQAGEPSNFQRWSLLGSLRERAERNEERFDAHVRGLVDWLSSSVGGPRDDFRGPGATATKASAIEIEPAVERLGRWTVSSLSQRWILPIFLGMARDLHYTRRPADHYVCYQVRGQETPVWCVGASTQMVLDFYRYEYTQDRLATELGLGTRAAPNGLPFGQEWKVVAALQNLTCSALTAAQDNTPNFPQFVSEINQNRPLISFIPGHSRTVAGYYWTLLPFPPSLHRGLLVYDPWPPNAGVITRYENFDTQTYRVTFTAHVCTVP